MWKFPTWALVWFFVFIPVQVWDALYIVLRPDSMEGGKWASFWSPYQIYIQVDARYADLNDGFVIAQSWWESCLILRPVALT